MNKEHKNLIIAAEIAGFLHDLGKVCPEFANEGMQGGTNLSSQVQDCGIAAAHGAILEENTRAYPATNTQEWLNQIKAHSHWQSTLKLPNEWVHTKTVQAEGLGGPLRQHHATGRFPENELSLLGDIYTFGADIRDSALDKASSGALSGKQSLKKGFIADSFGDEQQSYGSDELGSVWEGMENSLSDLLFNEQNKPWENTAKTRESLYKKLGQEYKKALGETRRPTNDVTLWHHCFSTASLFKASVAEGVLQQNFSNLQGQDGLLDLTQSGRLRFRLLSVRWDWEALTSGALKPVIFSALASKKRQAIKSLKELLELKNPIGNCIYEDDNGAIFVVPAFYSGDSVEAVSDSTELFNQHIIKALQTDILNALTPLGTGTPVRLAWTQPALYLTDYPQVLATHSIGKDELILQVGLEALQADWVKKQQQGQAQICPQCGLRPAVARELEVYQSGLDDENKIPQGWCTHCESLTDERYQDKRRQEAFENFGFQPETFNLQTIREKRNQGKDNARVVLISVQINAQKIASGEALVTQLARPLDDLELKKNLKAAQESGDFLNTLWHKISLEDTAETLQAKITKKEVSNARKILGDKYWLDFYAEKDDDLDGRSLSQYSGGKCIEIAENFFLKESIPDDLGLCRHTGDRLLLFGLRKHASPGRLARTWDDLAALWKEALAVVAGITEQYAMPLSVDAQGFRVIVAAEDSSRVLLALQTLINTRLQKVRGGIAPQISALVFKDKFPLYVAMDALRRMEQRPELRQEWAVDTIDVSQSTVNIHWQTPQGKVSWSIDVGTGDPEQLDIWHPRVICSSKPEGVGRIILLSDLQVGDVVNLPVSGFDFTVLDTTVRRYELAYGAQGKRAHFILGKTGRSPYLIEQMPDLLDKLPTMISHWNSSQAKSVLGQVVECYEKWVRDVPEILAEDGRQAWHSHVKAILCRMKPALKEKDINTVIAALDDGMFFDAFEWSGFIEKTTTISEQG